MIAFDDNGPVVDGVEVNDGVELSDIEWKVMFNLDVAGLGCHVSEDYRDSGEFSLF